ncbi:glucose-6-phosphate isomerase [Proteinivorax hydrogeniformans]|uniref:Glucose-6-phosphate isomerase n=1 Tax=Proteinivorax hydrogeniformans TaxID=1826727 RepID=A0AAU8HVR5_9FIRM
MSKLRLDYKNASSFLKEGEMEMMAPFVKEAHRQLHDKTGAGNDFLGWVDLPKQIDEDEIQDLKETAERIKKNCDVFLVIGIGGSYLGAKAAIEMLSHTFHNELSHERRKAPQIHFVGQNISGTYMKHLMELIENKEVMVNVISKSGTTTEPAVAFRIIRGFLEEKYGKEGAKQRIIATTDKSKGALRTLADQEGYKTFVIEDDIGGRFSVLTPVGLLPIAVSGADIDEIIKGAAIAYDDFKNSDFKDNHCYQYAVLRNIFYRKGKTVEVMANYEPSLNYLSEWWKQLYGESEGKDHKGLFPASVNFTTDLHSMGQYIQDGLRNLFETVIKVKNPKEDIALPTDEQDLDGLNYLAGKTVNFINEKALQGTMLAHTDGGVPNIVLNIDEISEQSFGYLVYFFEKACGISGYLLGVNPFDQPGVEDYKKNMFALLGKKGFEKEKEKLENRLK